MLWWLGFQRHQWPWHSGVRDGHSMPLNCQYLHGFPLLITSTTYWKSMFGTQWNQCINPWRCGLLQEYKPILSKSRVKNTSICQGQHMEVTARNPNASSDAVSPSTTVPPGGVVVAISVVVIESSASSSSRLPKGSFACDSSTGGSTTAPAGCSYFNGNSKIKEPKSAIWFCSSIGVPASKTISSPISKPI